MMQPSDAHWFAVQTHVRAEGKAVQHLVRQGFEVYLPRYLKRRRHARKIETIAAPLFPGYLFVTVDFATQRWRSIHSTFGVSRLVTNGDEPAIMASGIVDALRQREDENGFIRLERRPNFSPGDKVRVLAGAFIDSFGVFDGMGDRERVAILLDLLGRKVRVLIDEDMVATA